MSPYGYFHPWCRPVRDCRTPLWQQVAVRTEGRSLLHLDLPGADRPLEIGPLLQLHLRCRGHDHARHLFDISIIFP